MSNVAVETMAPAFHKALKDFGYDQLELSVVKEIVTDYLDGKDNGEVRGPAVFKMFIKGWMKEAGAI